MIELDEVFRSEYGRIIATLVRLCGDIQLAEEAAQDAFLAALTKWPETGTPPNPGGWLTTTARNRLIDRLRREATRDARQQEAADMIYLEPDGPAEPPDLSSVVDDRLRLMFTCCHPALAMEARVALTLKLLGGLSTAEIAMAFFVPETTMAQRLTRAKRKIAANRIPYRVPGDAELPSRLAGVLAALYLIFNEGYLSNSPDEPIRHDLSAEAIRLTRLIAQLMPDEPEVIGLLALMLLTDARRTVRVADGALVPLPEQDRSGWDAELIGEGHDLVRACLRRGKPGPYQILAAMNAVHTDAGRASDTDWRQIVALYDQLLYFTPTPIVRLNRAVAVAEVDGPEAGLTLIDQLDLGAYHAWHVARADLLRRIGRTTEAAAAYRRAIELAGNSAERRYLTTQLEGLD